ncbi:MAG TPA: hypothetical protein VKB86_10570 [Pyrinomonadaceae bacterium]|nr:hypothetical protein [Pyrinomonadaceae bacterium]
MPILSDGSITKRYTQRADFDARLADVKKVIATLLKLSINLPLKKRLLVHSVWEVTKLGGDFKGRYRSKGVMVSGVEIQRDHVIQKARIVKRLLANPEQIETILGDVVHCVVTKAEHERLTAYSRMNPDIDGWERYKGAGVEVIDMLTGEQWI